MVQIIQRLVSSSIIATKSYGHKNKRTHITIHETGNVRAGANAEMHARLQSTGNSREASWHYQVDEKQIIQSFPHTVSCWHGGDGKLGTGNLHSIAIEICVNSDGDFKKAVQNAAELVRHIMKLEKIPIQNVVQHNLWSGKNCPTYLRNGSKGINWADFIRLVKEDTAPKPVPPKEVDELTNYMDEKLPGTQRQDAEKLFERAYKDGYFSVNHAPKVANMTRRQFHDLKLSYEIREKLGIKVL